MSRTGTSGHSCQARSAKAPAGGYCVGVAIGMALLRGALAFALAATAVGALAERAAS